VRFSFKSQDRKISQTELIVNKNYTGDFEKTISIKARIMYLKKNEKVMLHAYREDPKVLIIREKFVY
jgi:tRNA U54 and U55 pseudouridine synthase Pus10